MDWLVNIDRAVLDGNSGQPEMRLSGYGKPYRIISGRCGYMACIRRSVLLLEENESERRGDNFRGTVQYRHFGICDKTVVYA